MPERIVKVPARAFLRFVDHHQRAVITALMFALVIALGVAVSGWTAARNAEQRVNALEVARTADQAAAAQGAKIAQVTSCFNAAKTRPLLTTILRALAANETDPAVRAAFDQLISDYETASTPGLRGSPTDESCTALAKQLGVDPQPYRSR